MGGNGEREGGKWRERRERERERRKEEGRCNETCDSVSAAMQQVAQYSITRMHTHTHTHTHTHSMDTMTWKKHSSHELLP